MKTILSSLCLLVLFSCSNTGKRSFNDKAASTANVIIMTPVFIVGISYLEGEKLTQKTAITSKAPAKWYSDEISADRIQAMQEPHLRKLDGPLYYMGSRDGYHFFAKDLIGRQIYRVDKFSYEVNNEFRLSSLTSKWRQIEIPQFKLDPPRNPLGINHFHQEYGIHIESP